ncbi:MAG: hypothetical protein IJB16_01715 [Clostridia bacterium]|nr:hypothetical protein [Clostridia bacterium]
MKKTAFILSVSIIIFSLAFAGCKGAEGGKVTDANDNTPVLTELETELSSMADRVTDIIPDMTGNISDTNADEM